MKHATLILGVLLFVAAVAQATPTVTLSITTTGTVWRLYATVSSDCAGLASFDISFGGAPGPMITSSTLKAPKPLDNGLGAFAGFASAFNSKGTISGGAVYDLQAGQCTPYGDVNDPAKDSLVLPGVGQFNGTWYPSDYGQPDGGSAYSWTSPTLIAQGTMSGLGLIVPLSATGNVLSGTPGYSFWAADFNQDRKVSFADYLILERNFGHSGMTNAQGDATGDGKVMYADYQLLESQFGNFGMENSWKGPGNVERANFVFGSMPVPEPASLSLLAAGGLSLLRWRR